MRPHDNKRDQRLQLERDTREFVKNGGLVQRIPFGVQAQDWGSPGDAQKHMIKKSISKRKSIRLKGSRE